MKLFLYLFISLGLFACGSSSDDNNTVDGAAVMEEVPESNVISKTQFFGQEGNLYKPKGDPLASGAGNMVVLLSSKFTTQFDSCEIKKKSGETAQLTCLNSVPWTQTPFSCFSNGNRQTWRANFKCSDVAEIKVVCQDSMQEVTFTLENEAARTNVCGRY